MAPTSLRQKIFLIVLGIFLSFVLCELGLRTGGYIFTFLQERRNKATFSDDEIRILCIGESTTALGAENSYPSLLEKTLRSQQSQKNFKVINKGLVGKTSEDILSELERNIKEYKPHLVVGMIGINDQLFAIEKGEKTSVWQLRLQKFRLYQLFSFLGMHIRAKIKEQRQENPESSREEFIVESLPPEELDNIKEEEKLIEMLMLGQQRYFQLQQQLEGNLSEEEKNKLRIQLSKLNIRQGWLLIRLGRYHRMRENYSKAQKYFKMALQVDSQNYAAYVEWARCFKEMKDYPRAIVLLEKARRLEPQSVLTAVELQHIYATLGQDEKAYQLARWIIQQKPKDIWHYSQVGNWLLEHQYFKEAQEAFEKAVQMNPLDFFLYEQLSRIYQAQGMIKKAEQYSRKAQSIEQETVQYRPMTVRAYNKIADILFSKNIPLICMQYPRRSIEPLKEIFWSGYPIIFVENKKNFDAALKDSEYAKYFSDNFAGNFGHCTREGNALIAENLAGVILTEVLSQ